jgi:type II secretory pathway pseudopilin PulG
VVGSIGPVELLVGLVVLVLIALLIVFLVSRRSRARRNEERRGRTRQEFGAEYERTARERGSEEEAESELRRRRGRVERQVTPLPGEDRRRYEERMKEVERAVEMADRTVTDLLEDRNFVADPAQSDEETERALAVMYPEVADDYREARRVRAAVVSRASRGDGDQGQDGDETENLRQTLRRYRAVYDKLAQG